MTRRERLERKRGKREQWAESASARASARFGTAHAIADVIPLGQPILVGHHSEHRARRDQSRIENNMRKGCEETDKAEYHTGKADGITRQLNHSIFSDDKDAIEALEARISKNEEQAKQYKQINAAWRKGGAAALQEMGLSEQLASKVATTMELCPWLKQPLDTTNLRARIRSDHERIEDLKRSQGAAAPREEDRE